MTSHNPEMYLPVLWFNLACSSASHRRLPTFPQWVWGENWKEGKTNGLKQTLSKGTQRKDNNNNNIQKK